MTSEKSMGAGPVEETLTTREGAEEMRKVGGSGLVVSEPCFGAVTFGERGTQASGATAIDAAPGGGVWLITVE